MPRPARAGTGHLAAVPEPNALDSLSQGLDALASHRGPGRRGLHAHLDLLRPDVDESLWRVLVTRAIGFRARALARRRLGRGPIPDLRADSDPLQFQWLRTGLAGRDRSQGKRRRQVLLRVDRSRRRQRFMYQGLHSLDFEPLRERPWLREALVLLLSAMGIASCITSCVIGWRALVPKATARKTAGRRTA